jgi:putative NADH-flavin reductase
MEEDKMKKKIAVVAANGRVANKVIEEAVNRGFEVTGFGRHENNTKAQHYVQKDLFDLTAEDLRGFDVVVDAAGAWTLETMYVIPKAAITLADLVKGTDTRLVVVGGAGRLYVNKEHTSTVELQPSFPDAYKPVSAAHGLALALLRATEGVKWTYISPAGDFQADGERSGKYILGGEELTLNSRNESIISYADYAIALVDEIEKGNHIQQRISIVRA